MTRLKYSPTIPGGENPYFFLYEDAYIDDFSKTSVRVGIVDSDFYITYTGTGFTQKQGNLTGGTITSVSYNDDMGNTWIEASKVNLKINKNFDVEHQEEVFANMLAKNDTVIGSYKNDFLLATGGNDVVKALNGDDVIFVSAGQAELSGNLGSDTFAFIPAKGSKMVVTDFDANGGGDAQDYLWFFDKEYRAFEVGKNTKIVFDDGGVVLLEGVDRGDISSADFQTPPILF